MELRPEAALALRPLQVQMTKEGDEVLKEFVRRVNSLLDRLQKAAGLGVGQTS